MTTPCPARIVVNGYTHICGILLSSDGTHGDWYHESDRVRWFDTDARQARLVVDQRLALEALATFDAQQSHRGRVTAMHSALRQAFADALGLERQHSILNKATEEVA